MLKKRKYNQAFLILPLVFLLQICAAQQGNLGWRFYVSPGISQIILSQPDRYQDNPFRYKLSFSAAMLLNYQLTESIVLAGGIKFMNKGYVEILEPPFSNQPFGITVPSELDPDQAKIKHNFNYTGIPIEAICHFTSDVNSLYMIGGMSPAFHSRTFIKEKFYLDGDKVAVEKNTIRSNNLRKINLEVLLGLGKHWLLSGAAVLFIEGRLEMLAFDPFKNYIETGRPYSLGLAIGLDIW